MVYRTMQGKEIDFDKLVRSNELVPAVGNMNVNARGDQLGPGGNIVKKREEVVAEYYEAKTPKRKIVAKEEIVTDNPAIKKNKITRLNEEEDEGKR